MQTLKNFLGRGMAPASDIPPYSDQLYADSEVKRVAPIHVLLNLMVMVICKNMQLVGAYRTED